MQNNYIKIDSQFLIRVIRNQVSENEKEYFENWLNESEEHKEEFGNLLLLWEEMDKAKVPDLPAAEEQWAVISEKIKNKTVHVDTESIRHLEYLSFKSGKNKNSRLSFISPNSIWLVRIAAILILTFSFAYIYSSFISNKPFNRDNTRTTFSSNTSNIKYEKVTSKGERVTFPLSDGSIVYLNSDSKLIYPKYFSNNERKLELVGEAYFTVKPNRDKPFKVVCGNMTVVVTGTEFNVKNRDNRIKVVVAKGTVRTYSEKTPDGISLQKGEMVSLEKNGFITKPVKVDLDLYLAWRQNKLSFSRTPLAEAMKEIERYYNIDVEFLSNENKTRTITGIFQTDKTSLDDILNILSLTLDIKINHENNKIFVQ